MHWLIRFYRSPVGMKAVMAVTGLVLFGFVLGHMIGNLKVFAGIHASGPYMGRYVLDAYGEGLRYFGAPFLAATHLLWIVRFVLLASVLLHIHAAWVLSRHSNTMRPVKYSSWKPQASTYASRTLRWGGVIVGVFVVYHLLHLSVGVAHPDHNPGLVYRNVVLGFMNPWVSAFYIVANVMLGLHLYHGLWSLLQSLGGFGPRLNPIRKLFSQVFAIAITAGNVSIPVGVLAGFVQLPG
jgi:succinate dehydrogenase / fumarate reductase cytochrome b subunit